VRIIFVTDLHGNENLYHELTTLTNVEEPTCVILGGDLIGYARDAESQISFVRGFLGPWMSNLDSRITWIPGNVDWPEAVDELRRITAANATQLESRSATEIGTWGVVGYPWVPPTPFRIKLWEKRDHEDDNVSLPCPSFESDANGHTRQISDPEFVARGSIEEDMAGMDGNNVWVVHTPPYGTPLDRVTGSAQGQEDDHRGSRAVTAAIHEKQPPVTLHGHIHESPIVSGKWATRIGRTLAINPGSGSKLHAVVFETTDSRIVGLRHTVFGPTDMPEDGTDGVK
jgi:uncharacterized protein